MGTSNPTLMHLFGVDRAIVEEAIATVESTIDGWNKEAGTIVGHPIVYVLRDPDESSTAPGEYSDDKKTNGDDSRATSRGDKPPTCTLPRLLR
ncbi:MAG: hypothetical protein SGARI_003862 [Bacillariaceae sp.]